MNLAERAAAFETTFYTRDESQRAALVNVFRTMITVFGPGGAPEEDLFALFDLLQNMTGKIQRGLKTQEEVLQEVATGAPRLVAEFMAALVDGTGGKPANDNATADPSPEHVAAAE
jgi:hypothetical protein